MECLTYLFASARGCGHGIPRKVLERVKGDADGVVHSEVDKVAHLLQPLVLDCNWHLRIGRADLGHGTALCMVRGLAPLVRLLAAATPRLVDLPLDP